MDDTPPSDQAPAASDTDEQAVGAVTDFPASRPNKMMIIGLAAGAVAILAYLLAQ